MKKTLKKVTPMSKEDKKKAKMHVLYERNNVKTNNV